MASIPVCLGSVLAMMFIYVCTAMLKTAYALQFLLNVVC
jgi:hypothetical protein